MEPEYQDSNSITVHDDELMSDADSDWVSGSNGFSRQGMVKLEESDGNEKIYTLIRRNLPLSMGSLGNKINVVAIHQKIFSEAKLKAFHEFSQEVAARSGGNGNLKNAWYGGSRGEICEVLDHGFGRLGGGVGLCLSHVSYPLHSVIRAKEDVEGLRHIVLCRVILGKTGTISGDFDSGVDNPSAPTKYMVWNADMIAHIMPCYIVTFTAPSLPGRNWTPPKRSNSV